MTPPTGGRPEEANAGESCGHVRSSTNHVKGGMVAATPPPPKLASRRVGGKVLFSLPRYFFLGLIDESSTAPAVPHVNIIESFKTSHMVQKVDKKVRAGVTTRRSLHHVVFAHIPQS
jgi:hypothetical protein